MNEIFIAFGSNKGERNNNILEAISLIKEKVNIIEISSFLENDAINMLPGHDGSFINGVLKGNTELDPNALLEYLHSIENKMGRERSSIGNQARTIDLDILLYNDVIFKDEKLTIPHPRMHERLFVIRPMMEIASDKIIPGINKTVRTILNNLENHPLDSMELPYKFIAIEGNIGSGKTSLANYLVSLTNGVFLPERFEENPFLADFYENKDEFALNTETFFLNDRKRQLEKHFAELPELTISDFSIYKSLVFSAINLKPTHFQKFESEFNKVIEKVTKPDIIIYLEAHPSVCLHQIHKRGRNYESNISEKYLEEIDKAYLKFWQESKGINILQIPASYFHFPFNLVQMEHFLSILISTEIKGIRKLTPKMS